MKKQVLIVALVMAIVLLVLAPVVITHAQSNISPAASIDAAGNKQTTFPNALLAYSNTALGFSNGSFANTASITSNTINTAQAHYATLSFTCTGNVDVYAIPFDETGLVAQGTGFKLNAAATPGDNQIFIGTELTPNVTSGTQTVPFRFPQRSVQFKITNVSGGAASCTYVRLLVGY